MARVRRRVKTCRKRKTTIATRIRCAVEITMMVIRRDVMVSSANVISSILE